MTNIDRFIESIAVSNTAKVVRHVLGNVDSDIEKYTSEEVEQFILALEPNSPKAITTICYVLGLYARWLQSKNNLDGHVLQNKIQDIDKQDLWRRAKPAARKKFISNSQYNQVLADIGLYEAYNPLHYQTLFKAVYEGIYCDDLSVLKNLRKSDINGNVVLLHEDNGNSYEIKISEQLASELSELAQTNIWERQNRYGLCRIGMRGIYYDSVFKIEDRKTAADRSYKFTFYAKLRKITKEYLEYPMLPFQLYISGIMHRIKVELATNGIPLEIAFSNNSRDRAAHTIISSELARSNYTAEVGNFREIVKGHLDSF